MKLENFAYRIVLRTLELLQIDYHYKIPKESADEIAQQIKNELTKLMDGEPSS